MNPRELEWLRRVRDLSQQLGSEDPSQLPPRILDAALELTGAERALLVQLPPPDSSGRRRITVLAGRGFSQGALEGAGGAVPRAAVERAIEEGRGLTTSREADQVLISNLSSVLNLGVQSLACVPLRLRGETCGALYLDHRGQEGLFRTEDLPTLQTFAAQAAISLELAREAEATAPSPGPHHLIGSSPPWQALLDEIRRVSRDREPVLVWGETGTELGLVARELHAQGPDRLARFRLVGCGDRGAELRRLLGSADKVGALSVEGTIALEEVDLLDLELQRVLARALADGSFTVPGTSRNVPLRARLIALTHADLPQLADAGQFRADLFYRLDVQRLVVPPLRQRSEDLPALCEGILRRLNAELEFTPSCLERLQRYAWPGNVLELESELRQLAARGGRVDTTDLSDRIREGRGLVQAEAQLAGLTLGEIEENLVRKVMDECGGVKARAARQLGIPRSTLYHLLDRYGIR